jgi:hypothetical protein
MSNHCDETSRVLSTVREIVAALGGTGATAERLGIGPPAVTAWINRGVIPPSRFLQIQAELNALGLSPEQSLFQQHSRTTDEEDAA